MGTFHLRALFRFELNMVCCKGGNPQTRMTGLGRLIQMNNKPMKASSDGSWAEEPIILSPKSFVFACHGTDKDAVLSTMASHGLKYFLTNVFALEDGGQSAVTIDTKTRLLTPHDVLLVGHVRDTDK